MALQNWTKTLNGTWYRTYNNGNAWVSDSGTAATYRVTGMRSSVNTPGFHNPARQGKLPNNPFEFSLREDWPVYGSQQRRTPGLVSGQGGFYYLNVTGPDGSIPYYGYSANRTVPSALRSKVTTKLLSKIKGQSANLSELFAEREKTAKMLGDTAWNFINCFLALKKGDFPAAARHLGVPPRRRAQSRFSKDYMKRGAVAAANGWLALKYGWQPLMEDIYGSCEALAKRNEGPAYVTTSYKAQLTEPFKSFNQTHDGGTHYTTTKVKGKTETFFRQSVTYYKSPSPASALSKLGITNPTLLAWELIPYSFVVDWFLPIGSWLGTFDATLDLTFHSGYETIFSRCQATYEKTVTGKYSNYVDDWFQYARMNDIYCKRTPLTSFPSPCIPHFKNPVSLVHMANGIALLTSVFSKRH